MKESQIAVMEEFVDNVKILISALGYKVLEPLNKPIVKKIDDENSLEVEEISLHLLFSSPSYAAMFVIGKSANGLTSWKDESGRSLKEIESSETK